MSQFPVMTVEDGDCVAFPDVCKVPPSTPTPFPNSAAPPDGYGSRKVRVRNSGVLRRGDKINRTTKDEPGSAGGVVSATVMDTAKVRTGSPKVSVEGKPCAHHTVMVAQNGNNANAPPGTHVKASQKKVKVKGVPPPDLMSRDEFLEWMAACGVTAASAAEAVDAFTGGMAREEHVKSAPGTPGQSKTYYRVFDSRSRAMPLPDPSRNLGLGKAVDPVTGAKEWTYGRLIDTRVPASAGKEFAISNRDGRWLSADPPLSQAQQTSDFALPLCNNADECVTKSVKPCTFVASGPTAPQSGPAFHPNAGKGGGDQTYVPNGPGGKLPIETTSAPFPIPP